MSKTEKLIHKDEYTSPEWYYAQLADDWFCADMKGDYMVMRKMSENGYAKPQHNRQGFNHMALYGNLTKHRSKFYWARTIEKNCFTIGNNADRNHCKSIENG